MKLVALNFMNQTVLIKVLKVILQYLLSGMSKCQGVIDK